MRQQYARHTCPRSVEKAARILNGARKTLAPSSRSGMEPPATPRGTGGLEPSSVGTAGQSAQRRSQRSPPRTPAPPGTPHRARLWVSTRPLSRWFENWFLSASAGNSRAPWGRLVRGVIPVSQAVASPTPLLAASDQRLSRGQCCCQICSGESDALRRERFGCRIDVMSSKIASATSLDGRHSEDQLQLKNRALAATAEGITIADARLPDNPPDLRQRWFRETYRVFHRRSFGP
jgi:hypothetical protein